MTPKKVLITGASGGIGGAIAKKLRAEGYELFLHAHTNQSGFLSADLADEKDIDRLLTAAEDADIFIHSVSAPIAHAEVAKKTWHDFEQHLSVQVKAFFCIAQKLLPRMQAKKYGKIIPIVTEYVVGRAPTQIADYVSAKYALLGLSKCIAAEYGRYGISCNAVSPGTTETKLTAHLPKKLLEMIAHDSPRGRLTTTDEIADVVTFLCSDAARGINGENILVTGGNITH